MDITCSLHMVISVSTKVMIDKVTQHSKCCGICTYQSQTDDAEPDFQWLKLLHTRRDVKHVECVEVALISVVQLPITPFGERDFRIAAAAIVRNHG